MEFTKEQLQRIIESADDVLSAQAGTNEDVHPESDDMIRLWDYLNDVAAPPEVVKRLAEIALASLEAEPVGTFRKGPCGYSPSFHEDAVQLYAAPPAPVVSDERGAFEAFMAERFKDTIDLSRAKNGDQGYMAWDMVVAWIVWQRRASMLQGAVQPQKEPQNIPENIPAPQFKTVADLYGISVPGGRTISYSTDAAEASDCRVMGWTVQEYVQLERYQEAMTANSLVILDDWQLMPRRLSAENGAKGALSGEFSETKFINCPECFGDEECETCDGSGRIKISVPVSWTTIKAIWAKGVEHFAAVPQLRKR